MIAVLGPVFLATLVAAIGGVVGVLAGRVSDRYIKLLVGFAGAVLFAVTMLDILPESYLALGVIRFTLAVGSGYGLLWLVSRKLFHICPACAFSKIGSGIRLVGGAPVLLSIAVGIHSALDGLGLVAGQSVAGHRDLGLGLALMLHKLPEGLALAVLLVGMGIARRRALAYTVAAEALTIAGGLIAVFAASRVDPIFMAAAFANVGGGFLFLIGSPFLPARHLDTDPSGARSRAVAGFR